MTLVHGQEVTNAIIRLAIEVHRHLGPGLLESAYEECLCCELQLAEIPYARQVPLPVVYKDVRLDCGYRMDIVVANKVVVEVKAVQQFAAIHEAQMLTYLRLSGCRIGLLLNFHQTTLKEGLRRFVL